MEKIFVIQASGGSYDDAWQHDLFAVRGEERAQAEIERLKQLHADCLEMLKEVTDALHQGYAAVRAINAKDFKLPPAPQVPAKANKEIQAAYRKKHDAWRKECEPIWRAISEEQNRAMVEAQQAARNKAVELGATEEHLQMFGFYNPNGELTSPSFDRDTHYTYEELELR